MIFSTIIVIKHWKYSDNQWLTVLKILGFSIGLGFDTLNIHYFQDDKYIAFNKLVLFNFQDDKSMVTYGRQLKDSSHYSSFNVISENMSCLMCPPTPNNMSPMR